MDAGENENSNVRVLVHIKLFFPPIYIQHNNKDAMSKNISENMSFDKIFDLTAGAYFHFL